MFSLSLSAASRPSFILFPYVYICRASISPAQNAGEMNRIGNYKQFARQMEAKQAVCPFMKQQLDPRSTRAVHPPSPPPPPECQPPNPGDI